MSANHHILLAIDDSDASRKAVSYVARVVGDSARHRIRLLHVLPPIPTGLLEHGGCDPGAACPAEREVLEGTARWRQESERAASGMIEEAEETLREAGVAPDRIEVRFAAPLPEETIGFHVLRAARELGCETVVVGRAPRNWFGNVLHRSPAKALLGAEVSGLAIWIVT
jgi:nucleotide-binding universal stress UspA family protein